MLSIDKTASSQWASSEDSKLRAREVTTAIGLVFSGHALWTSNTLLNQCLPLYRIKGVCTVCTVCTASLSSVQTCKLVQRVPRTRSTKDSPDGQSKLFSNGSGYPDGDKARTS